jgi:thymidylate kinase
MVIYLRLPAAEAQRLVAQKGGREYTDKKMDILEADLQHLRDAASVYDRLAKGPNWAQIECFDATRNALRTPEHIHADVVSILEARRLLR